LTGAETGSGTLTTSSEACGSGCAIEAGTFHGKYNGQSITGLDTGYGGTPPDNLLFYPASSSHQVDLAGISFDYGTGGAANIYHDLDTTNPFDFLSDTDGAANVKVIFSASPEATIATPLPAALPLFATGVGGLGLLGWRRRPKAGLA
jgi:hypothetical protein